MRFRRAMRRVGYLASPFARLLSLSAENPAIFAGITVAAGIVGSIAYAWIAESSTGPYVRAALYAAVITVPAASCVAFYLFNLTHGSRAELAIRARRHSDVRILDYLLRSIGALLDSVFDLDGPQPALRWRLLMESEREYARSRSHFLSVLLDRVASHFRVRRSRLEQFLGVSVDVVHINAPQRVWLRYQIHLRAAHSAMYRPSADRLDEYARRARDSVGELRAIAVELPIILRHVIDEPSTSAALAAAAAVSARHIGIPSLPTVLRLIDIRHGVPLTLLLGLDGPRLRHPVVEPSARHYLRSFGALARRTGTTAADVAARLLLRRNYQTILTVGFSALVAETIRMFCAQHGGATVGIIIPDAGPDDGAMAARDVALMRAQLALGKDLHSRVFVADTGGLWDLGFPFGDAVMLMGAEAVTGDGRVVHPRGWRMAHEDVRYYLARRRVPLDRVVVAESFKIVDVDEDVLLRRVVGCFDRDEYELLVCDRGTWATQQGPLPARMRRGWQMVVDAELRVAGLDALGLLGRP